MSTRPYIDIPVYMAVPLLPSTAYTENDCDANGGRTETRKCENECSCVLATFLISTLSFSSGALTGVICAFVGVKYVFSAPEISPENYPTISILWSCLATLAAHSMFTLWLKVFKNVQLPVSKDCFGRTEYFFAIGDFLGYCAALTVKDARDGVEPSHLISTSLVAFLWLLIMVLYAVCNEREGEEEVKTSNRGTVLPIVLV